MSTETNPSSEQSSWPATIQAAQLRSEALRRQAQEKRARLERMANACQELWGLILPTYARNVPPLDTERCHLIATELLTIGQALTAEGHGSTVAILPPEQDVWGFAADLVKYATAGDRERLDAALFKLIPLLPDQQKVLWDELADVIRSVIDGSAEAKHARRLAEEAAKQVEAEQAEKAANQAKAKLGEGNDSIPGQKGTGQKKEGESNTPLGANLTRRRRGRPRDTDLQADRLIFNAWRTRQYKTYADLARELNKSTREVRAAIDRHRKRVERASK